MHALIKPSTLEFTGRLRNFVGETPPVLRAEKDLKWVPVLADPPDPAFDPDTEKVVFGPHDITIDSAQRTKQVVPLSAGELKDKANAAKLENMRNSIDTLRQWAQDAQNVTVTPANHEQVTQVLANRIGVVFDRLADLVEGQGLGA